MVDRCTKCGRKARRSNEANRRYWMLIYKAAAELKPDGKQYSPDTYHLYYRLKYLGGDDVTLPSGKVIVMPKSTADLDKSEFHEYAEKVEQDLNERGVYLDELPT